LRTVLRIALFERYVRITYLAFHRSFSRIAAASHFGFLILRLLSFFSFFSSIHII
jgi:hypothetical protein